jgi:hypothetical protein
MLYYPAEKENERRMTGAKIAKSKKYRRRRLCQGGNEEVEKGQDDGIGASRPCSVCIT